MSCFVCEQNKKINKEKNLFSKRWMVGGREEGMVTMEKGKATEWSGERNCARTNKQKKMPLPARAIYCPVQPSHVCPTQIQGSTFLRFLCSKEGKGAVFGISAENRLSSLFMLGPIFITSLLESREKWWWDHSLTTDWGNAQRERLNEDADCPAMQWINKERWRDGWSTNENFSCCYERLVVLIIHNVVARKNATRGDGGIAPCMRTWCSKINICRCNWLVVTDVSRNNKKGFKRLNRRKDRINKPPHLFPTSKKTKFHLAPQWLIDLNASLSRVQICTWILFRKVSSLLFLLQCLVSRITTVCKCTKVCLPTEPYFCAFLLPSHRSTSWLPFFFCLRFQMIYSI